MNCTGCPALQFPLSGGACVAGVRTGTAITNGRRTRHPLSTCKRPRNSAELAERIEAFEIEKKEVDTN